MNNPKVFIAIAAHKSCDFLEIPFHKPVCVGAVVNRERFEGKEGIYFDDSGDNISVLNPVYNELTAQYWMWMNLDDYDYLGLCHYRRYFNFSEKTNRFPRIPCTLLNNECYTRFSWNNKTILETISKYDIILARPEIDTPVFYYFFDYYSSI